MYAAMPAARSTRSLEFGLYRDGDNNLDEIQEESIAQADKLSAKDSRIEFTVEDTTSNGRGNRLHTEDYTIADGDESRPAIDAAHDMSSRGNLARFVARTLDNAERSKAKQTWIDLIDHGGGDGGGLQADHGLGIMKADDIAGAIADGVAMHAKAHPEDAQRGIDGVVANQCLMATVAFSDALTHAGVKYLAASPETMLAPGVPTTVAEDVAAHLDDPAAMAKAMVARTMTTVYRDPGITLSPAAAFDVLDLDPQKAVAVEKGVAALNGAIVQAARNTSERAAIRQDARAVDGMVRDDRSGLPWHADRPAIELYRTLASDGRLDATLRTDASAAADAISAAVMAHGESDDFEPFSGKSYADAIGPTVHFPLTPKQVDPWKPQMSETDNAFYKNVGAASVTKALVA